MRIIGIMLLVLLLAGCKSDDKEELQEKQPTVLNVYVYAPEHPVITRDDVVDVDPIVNSKSESDITKLQIWVFNHETEELIAYYSPESVEDLNNGMNNGMGTSYQLSASEAFTSADPKPNVDVYVVANAASCGLTLGETTSRAELEGVMIGESYFGLSSKIDKVPDAGLPMSGVARNQSVSGSAPVYNISSVKLTRAVSKIRFVFSREIDDSEKGDNPVAKPVKITSIKLDSEMIPTQEYLFLLTDDGAPKYHIIDDSYVDEPTEFLLDDSPLRDDIAKNSDPASYSYQAGQDAQVYEELIAKGLNKTVPELSQVGPFYLRESDMKLKGTITYQKYGEKEKEATFEMHNEGDFSRNHTWIVYAYYSVSGVMAVTVVLKDWTDTSSTHTVYNW